MKILNAVAAGLVLALAPLSAHAWRAMNNNEVFPVRDGVFEVVSRVGSGATDFWCGAGDYAYRALGAASSQRVYLYRAIGPSLTRPGRKAVQFSLVPPPGADTGDRLSFSVNAVGDNLRAAAAQQYCYSGDRDDPFFRRP